MDYSVGSDANTGTSASAPWKHCPGDPVATSTVSTTSLTGGDTVFFKGGVAYVLTGSTGIILRSSGTPGSPITFDGNSDGSWGSGKARFTDNNGSNGIAAFSAPASISYLTFKGIDFGSIGGTSTLPPDTGTPVAPRFGAGLQFNAGVTNTTIDGCSFHDLGYWFNQKPMNAASIAGTGIGVGSCNGLTISNCDFSRMAVAIEMANATSLAALTITNCTFHDSVCWTVDLAPPPVTPTSFAISGSTETNNAQLSPANWTGYGPSPRTDVETATAGDTVTLTVTAAASPAASFQWKKNGTPIAGATTSTLTLQAVTTADSATYTAVATNSAGAATSNDAILTVNAAPGTAVAPTMTTQPVSQTVTAGSTVTFSVAATGTPAPSYQWLKNGTAIANQATATLTLTNVASADAAQYSAVAKNSAGSVTSKAASLTVTAAPAPTPAPAPSPAPNPTPTPGPTVPTSVAPVFTAHPRSQTVTAGSAVTFTAAAVGTPTPAYQWLHNGAAISGQTRATLTLPSVTTSDGGAYTLVASNSAGQIASNPAQLSVTSGTSELANLSVRGVAGTGSNMLMIGFVVSGSTPKSLLIRGIGPTLGTFSVAGALPDPQLSLFSGSSLLATNKGWSSSPDANGIAATSSQVGAFDLTAGSGDSALVPTVNAGAYTAQLSSATSNTGVALIELYDALTTPGSRLVNASVRTNVTATNSPIIGFVVKGTAPKKLLIRAIGPGLQTFSVDGALGDPKLEIFEGGNAIQANDNWGGDPALSDAFKSVGAFPLTNASSKDAAMILNAAPGAYSAVVTGVNGTSGVVLVEVYELP